RSGRGKNDEMSASLVASSKKLRAFPALENSSCFLNSHSGFCHFLMISWKREVNCSE
ncbi:11218_t:CDS:1, partial [Cetraspora pellucida]